MRGSAASEIRVDVPQIYENVGYNHKLCRSETRFIAIFREATSAAA